jgi:hypothetical protein
VLSKLRGFIDGIEETQVTVKGNLDLGDENIEAIDRLQADGFASVEATAVEPLPDGTKKYDSKGAKVLEEVTTEGVAASPSEIRSKLMELRSDGDDGGETVQLDE